MLAHDLTWERTINAVGGETAFERARVVKPSNSPWASPVTLVNKKDAHHRLNQATIKDEYPLS